METPSSAGHLDQPVVFHVLVHGLVRKPYRQSAMPSYLVFGVGMYRGRGEFVADAATA